MISVILGWAIPLTYLALGAVYARTLLRRWAHDPDSLAHGADTAERAFVAAGALLVAAFWPFAITFRALARWLWRPADHDLAKIDQMRADRDAWDQRAHSAVDPDERATARQIADTLDDLIRRAR